MKTSPFDYSHQAKTPAIHSPRSARKAALLSVLAALSLTAFASNAMADDYYWRGGGADTWNNLSKWTTGPTGGSSPSSFLSTDTFIVGADAPNPLGTDFTSTGVDSVFNGGTLQLESGGVLNLRMFGALKAQVGNFVTTGGGLITTAANGDVRLTVDTFDNQSGDTRVRASGTAGARTLDLQIGTLTGAGSFSIDSGNTQDNTIFISVTDASNYTGNFDFSRGTINFNNDLASGGALTLSGAAKLTLDQSVTFASVTIGGTALSSGFHSFTSLSENLDYGAFFTEGGSGGITVAAIPEPSTYAVLFGAATLGLAAGTRRRRRS